MKQKVHNLNRTVITDDLKDKMQDDRDAGMTIRGIAEKYGVGRTTVDRHTFASKPVKRYNESGDNNEMFVEKSKSSKPTPQWRRDWDKTRLEVLRALK